MRRAEDFDAIYLHRDAVDFRKSIDGLCGIVEQEMGKSPFGRELFVFTNRSRNKLKVLYFDRTGFALWYKRLERDRFHWPRKADVATVKLTAEQINWLLDGYDITKMRPHEAVKFSRVS